MKKTFLVTLIVIVFLIIFYLVASEPAITGAAVGVSDEKVVYLDNVKNIVERTTEILNDANKSTESALFLEITQIEYREKLKKNLEEIQGLKANLNSLNVPSSYKNHQETLEKEMDYYELTIKQMLNNIK